MDRTVRRAAVRRGSCGTDVERSEEPGTLRAAGIYRRNLRCRRRCRRRDSNPRHADYDSACRCLKSGLNADSTGTQGRNVDMNVDTLVTRMGVGSAFGTTVGAAGREPRPGPSRPGEQPCLGIASQLLPHALDRRTHRSARCPFPPHYVALPPPRVAARNDRNPRRCWGLGLVRSWPP